MMRDLDAFNVYLAEEHPELPPLPTEWVICDRCRGDGYLRGYPGVYTQYDFEDPEFVEGYMSHRRTCPDCNGTGKYRVPTEGGDPMTARLFREYLRDINESRAIEAAERRMGA